MIEGSYFPINVINIGIRQKNRESGKNVINMYHPSSNLIYSKIKKILESKNNKNFQNKFIYGKGGTAKKITKTLENIPFTKNLIQKQINY